MERAQNRGSESECPCAVKVAIVGAGIAGLAACRTLLDAGIEDVVLLEGQDHAGGRIHSCPLYSKSGELIGWLEEGAQWVHGQENPIYKLANASHLLSDIVSDEGLGQYLRENGEEVSPRLVHEVASEVNGILSDCEQFCETDNEPPPPSIGDYLSDRFHEYLEGCEDPPEIRKVKLDLLEWHVRFQVIDNSCKSLHNLSAKAWGCFQYCGGQDYMNFKEGYSSLVDTLVEQLPQGILKLNTTVQTIETGTASSPVVIRCNDGSRYLADHVIVTSSLGYLKRHHQQMFKPPLPHSIARSIDEMGFDPISKIFLYYEQPWWSEDMKGVQLIWSSTPEIIDVNGGLDLADEEQWLRDVSGFDVLQNVSGVLIGWVGRGGAVTVERLDEEEVGRHCTRILRVFTGRPEIPEPSQVFRSRWYHNEFTFGGYSHTTTRCDKTGSGPHLLSQPVYVETEATKLHPALLLAGEAVHEKYFSTTHGAYETGVSQAGKLIEFIRKSDVICSI